MRDDLYRLPIKEFKDSYLTIEDVTGLGIDINMEVVEKYALP